jgi:hypothetical protein
VVVDVAVDVDVDVDVDEPAGPAKSGRFSFTNPTTCRKVG